MIAPEPGQLFFSGLNMNLADSTRTPQRANRPWLKAVTVFAVVVTFVLHGTAAHAGTMQDDLCAGSGGPNGCSVSHTDMDDSINLGTRLGLSARGNPNVDVSLMVYLVEFNSAGAITDLIPASAPVTGRTSDPYGNFNGAQVTVFQPDGFPSGGWLFVGLTDDQGLDLTRRIGKLLQFGGDTLRLLGDGYAAQKPVGQTLTMDVMGQVPGIRYWIEYQDDSGAWVPVPGQGFHDSTRLSGPPSQRRQLSYHVPADLTVGALYLFRINSELNFGGAPNIPVAKPGYVEWTVMPSNSPVAKAKGKDFDPNLPAGVPDTEPTPQPSPEPTPTPQPTPTPSPSASATHRPSGPGDSGGGGTSQGPPASGSNSSAQQSPKPQTSTPTEDPESADTINAGSVWGQEASTADSAGTPLPASSGTARLIALLGLLIVAAPVAVWLVMRRRDPGLEETL